MAIRLIAINRVYGANEEEVRSRRGRYAPLDLDHEGFDSPADVRCNLDPQREDQMSPSRA